MIYFDNAATTMIKPQQVYSEILDVMLHKGGNPGRGGHLMADRASDVIYKARENLCELFNINSPENICFTNNATTALNYGIKGVLKDNDHVIISAFEHNSVLRPVCALEDKGVTYTVLPLTPEGVFDNIENYIRENTKLIVINHSSNVTGNIADIGEIGRIARKHGIIFMVDASQSAGHIDIDMERDNIDILACAGHKGLFGPQGTGLLYVREGIKLSTLVEGGTGSMSESIYQPEYLPDRFESGTLNTPGIGGLSKGIEFVISKKERIRQHEKKLTKMLVDGLSSLPFVTVYGNKNPEKMTAVVGFNIKDRDCVCVTNYLSDKYKIMLRGGLHCSVLAHKTLKTSDCGCVRASLSYFNTENEVNKFLNIIDRDFKM